MLNAAKDLVAEPALDRTTRCCKFMLQHDTSGLTNYSV